MQTVYDEKAYISLNGTAGAVQSNTSIGGSDVATTSTSTPVVSGTAETWEIRVSSSGVVTYLVDGSADTLLAAAAAVTFTSGDILIPSIGVVATGSGASAVELVTYECGLL